jgi:hypothetical protein
VGGDTYAGPLFVINVSETTYSKPRFRALLIEEASKIELWRWARREKPQALLMRLPS